MDIHYFIKNLKNVEKLNRTNPTYFNYSKELNKYILNYNSTKDLFNQLKFKSSCIPFILNLFLNDVDLTKFIENINNFILFSQIEIEPIINYLINIVSVKRIRYCFLETMKNKCLFNDTIFKKIFCEKYEKLNKFNSQNYITIDSIFLKILSTKKGTTMFLKLIKYDSTYDYNTTIEFLKSKDTFYKFLTIALIDIFNKQHILYIKSVDKDPDKFKFFSTIINLINNTYIHLIDELKDTSNSINIDIGINPEEDDFKNKRLINIKNILNNPEYNSYIDYFYGNTITWLNNIEIDTNTNTVKELVDTSLYNIYKYNCYKFNNNPTNKDMLIFFEKIFKLKLTKNFHIIQDYIYLLRSYMYCKASRKKYRYFDFYISKIILVVIDSYSFIYDRIDDMQNEQLELTLRMCEILNISLFVTNNYRCIFDEKYDKNPTNFLKIACLILENINTCVEQIDQYINKNIIINNPSYSININIGNYYYNCLQILLKTIRNMCNYYPKIIFSSELKPLFKTSIKNVIETNDTIKIDNDSVKYDSIEIYIKIKEIIMSTKNHSNLINEIDFSNLKKHLLHANKIDLSELGYLNKIIFNNTLEIINYKNIIHPEQFCDPITNSLIETPIMLPNNIIVDKSMICRYLLTHKMNPYNRQYLTSKLLDEYNRRFDIKKRIVHFEHELNEYKYRFEKQ